MKEYKNMPQDIYEKAEAIIQKAEFVTVASITEDGYPYPCVLSLLDPSWMKEVYFSTGTQSRKTAHFIANSKAGLTIQFGPDSIVMLGQVQIVDDLNMKEKCWKDWMIDHFPKGVTDPEYCLMRFTPHHAVVWIEGLFERYHIDSLSV